MFGYFRNPNYSDLPGGGILANLIALILVAYVSLVVYLVTKPDFQVFNIDGSHSMKKV